MHETVDFPHYHLQVGQEAPEGEVFYSLKALEEFPLRYIGKGHRGRVTREFFAKGALFERHWDL